MTHKRPILAVILLLVLLAWALPASASEDTPGISESDPLGTHRVVQVISSVFGFSVQQITDLHGQGIGVGAIFKLEFLAVAKDTSVADQIGTDGEIGFSFGQAFRQLTPAQLELIKDFPYRNLGQAIAATHRPSHAGQGQGRPDDPGSQGATHGHGHDSKPPRTTEQRPPRRLGDDLASSAAHRNGLSGLGR